MTGAGGDLDLLLPDAPLWGDHHAAVIRRRFRTTTDAWEADWDERRRARAARHADTHVGVDLGALRAWVDRRRRRRGAARVRRQERRRARRRQQPVRRLVNERDDVLALVEGLAGLPPGEAASALGGPVVSHRRPKDLDPVDDVLRSVLVAAALCHRERRLEDLRDGVAAFARAEPDSESAQWLGDVLHQAAAVELAEVGDALDRIEAVLRSSDEDPAARLAALATAGVDVGLEVAASDHEVATDRWESSPSGRQTVMVEDALEAVRAALDDAVCGPWSNELVWDESALTLPALLDRSAGRELDDASGWRPAARCGAIVRPDRRKHEWVVLRGLEGWTHRDVLDGLVARLASLEDEVARVRRDSIAEMATRRRGESRRLAQLAADLDEEEARLDALRAARRELGDPSP